MNRLYAAIGLLIVVAIAVFFILGPDGREMDATLNGDTSNESNTESSETPAGYIPYSNSSLDFEILRPEDSQVSTEATGAIKFMLLGPQALPNTEITDGFTLTVMRHRDIPQATLRAFAQERVETSRINGASEISELEAVTVGGKDSFRYSYQNLLGSTSFEYVFLPHAGRGYTATYTIADPAKLGYEDIVMEMIESLNFMP